MLTDEGRQEGRRHRKVDAPRTPYRWSVIAPLWCLGLPVITTYYGRYHYCHRHHHTYHQEKVVYAAFYFPVSDHSSS